MGQNNIKVTRGESVKKSLRDRGITPGKIQTSVTTRSKGSSKRTTKYYSGGKVTRIEESDPKTGEKKVTVKSGSPNLKNAPGSNEQKNSLPETKKFYDQNTGRQLSPFESFALQNQSGGMSTEQGDVYVTYDRPKKERSLVKEKFKREYPYLAAQTEAEIQERIFAPATALVRDAANKKAFEIRTEESLKRNLETARSQDDFDTALSNYRGFKQYQLLTDRESYGNIESKNVFKKTVGAFSLGAKSIGGATEELLFEQEAKLRFKDRQAIATDETGVYALNILKDSSREAAITGLKVSRNVIGGAVTDLGDNKIQAIVFAASFGLGAVSGAAQGTGAAAKVSAAAQGSVYTRSLVKGTSLGVKAVGAGAITYAGVKAAQSDDPVASLSRLGGQILSYSGAYKLGEAPGYSFGLAAKNTAQGISNTLKNIEIQPIYGKKGGVNRGGRRISPRSKVQIRQQNRGTFKDPRITQQKNSVTLKVRNKDLKSRYVKQRNIQINNQGQVRVSDKGIRTDVPSLKGSGTPSNKFRFKTSQAVPRPKAQGDYVLIKKPGFRKPVKVRTNPSFKNTQTNTGQVQILKQAPKTAQTSKVITQKSLRINDQKSFIKGDPARSRYAAQNIKGDSLKVDLGNAPVGTSSGVKGFRPGVNKASLVNPDKITYLKSGLRDVSGASLPPGNLARSVPSRVVPYAKESSLLFGTPQREETITYESKIQAEPVALAKSNSSSFVTAQAFEIKTDVANTEKIDSIIDQATIPKQESFISPRSGGGGKGSNTRIIPPDPVITPPKPTTPKKPFIKPPSRPPKTKDPIKLIPPFPSINRKDSPEARGFNVFARVRGSFQQINRSPLSLKDAIGFGSFSVGGSSAATFRVSKSSQSIGSFFKGRGSVQDFDRRPGGLFIEKNEKRINTPGELVQITRKGQAALRTRKVFGI